MKINLRVISEKLMAKAKDPQGLGVRLMWTLSALFGQAGDASVRGAGKGTQPKSAENLALSA